MLNICIYQYLLTNKCNPHGVRRWRQTPVKSLQTGVSPVNACQCLCVFLMSNIFTYIDIQNVVSMIYKGLYIKLNKNGSFYKYLNDPALVYLCVLDYNLSSPFWPLWYLHRTVMLYFLEFVLPSWPGSSRKNIFAVSVRLLSGYMKVPLP